MIGIGRFVTLCFDGVIPCDFNHFMIFSNFLADDQREGKRQKRSARIYVYP